MGIATEVKVDGIMVLTVVGIIAVGYVVYKSGDIIEEVKQGTNLTSEKNFINRATVHLLGLDEQGYDNLGSWFYCLTHEGAATCPK